MTTYTLDKILIAIEIAKKWHKGQKYGQSDYFEKHVEGVVANAMTLSIKLELDMNCVTHVAILAYLHDVLEDASDKEAARQDILEALGNGILTDLEYLNAKGSRNYDVYIARIVTQAPLEVLIIKYADMIFNYTDALMNVGHPKQEHWIQKYSKHIETLSKAVKAVANIKKEKDNA